MKYVEFKFLAFKFKSLVKQYLIQNTEVGHSDLSLNCTCLWLSRVEGCKYFETCVSMVSD